jgi:hypothetical protein
MNVPTENHLTEEQLVLYYYSEASETAGVEEHLGACESCRKAYHSLQRVLNSVDSLPVPDLSADYETRLWSALDARLGRRKSFAVRWLLWKPLVIAASMAVLIIAAFLTGRTLERPSNQQKSVADSGIRERVLLVAVGDHLERSQMVLVELANAGAPATGHLDISYEQRTAEDLLEANRLYRQTAASAGDFPTATLLEDLERVLLEIAHSPSTVSAKQLEDLRKQIEDKGILFKVKIFGSQVEQREAAPSKAGAASL